MAKDKKEAPAAPAAEGDEAPKKKGGMKMIIAAVVVVVLEAATVVITAKMSGGPKQVMAEQQTTTQTAPAPKFAEVKIIDARLPNIQNQKVTVYAIQVVAKVEEKDKKKVTDLFAERDAEIRDQIRTIIAGSEPTALNEPGLETLRRLIAYQLEQDVGKDLIKEVLIPLCNPPQTF